MASLINFLKNIDIDSSSSGFGFGEYLPSVTDVYPSSWKSLFGQEVTSFCYFKRETTIDLTGR
jgi:hypothetical protein